ncbi:MAG: DUF4292 domain-containing protein [Desulfobacula sp.]|jgi:hypothetical protein|uniref:hypothetical protein n=1 Tax=Desulfobacula sp. TaxID=2593537 RepID=UPI001D35D55C|nr:DUF4292 domain-containing protein [Desulfobacula sp.]MBT4875909.1 DUF4292 domain-containing protein [Desulfobacula sp.]MBT5543192.1 DUF4292 domain-containing protein [Desulfobacula sp.]MBT5970350.1 DUF4292 domain-containing protein [Desulfobacula sp.]MBT7048492.1 DUF4292 domain-containing protein [Desulfobacula sp.]
MINKNLFVGVRLALLRLSNDKRNNASLTPFVCIVLFILILSGCAQLRPAGNPLLDKKAFLLAKKAQSFNHNIIAGRGTGWARIETKKKTDKFRIAWAAVFPDKIRITFLISGHPLETIIATGEQITFFSHTGQHAKYSDNSKDPDMDEFINVPVKMSEIISILLGRLPVKKFDKAYFTAQDPSLSSIALEQNWKGVTQYLHFNGNQKIDGLKSTDVSGKLLYEMNIIKYKTYGSNQIPVKIEIKDMDTRKLTLDITGFQANPLIKESVFRLTEPL